MKTDAARFEDLNKTPIFYDVSDFQGTIGPSRTVAFRLPVGVTHLRNALHFTDGGVDSTELQILTDVATIIVKVSADQKMEMSGLEAIYLSAFWNARQQANFDGSAGSYIKQGILNLDYARETLLGAVNRNATAYGMKGQTSMQVEITFTGGTLTVDGIEMLTEVIDGAELGRHITIRKNTKTLGNSGLNEIYDLPIDPATNMYCIHFANVDKSAHDITHVEILANRTRIVNASTAQLLERSRRLGLYNSYHASVLSIPFTARGQNREALPMNMQDLLIRVTTSAANTYNILMERSEKEPSRSV